jgi:trehalose/maltose hydrolase-like predicted phosphorylase
MTICEPAGPWPNQSRTLTAVSRPMHALVAARLGYSEMALRYFREAAAIDLADTHVAIDGGVHIATLGGIWQTPAIRLHTSCGLIA